MSRKGDGGHKGEGPHLYGRAWAPGSPHLGWEGEMTVPSQTRNRKGEGQPGRDLGSLWDGMGWGGAGGLRMGLERRALPGPENQSDER